MEEESLGSILKHLRTRQNLSLRGAADLSGLSRTYILMLEKDKRDNPTLDAIKALAKAYESPIALRVGVDGAVVGSL